MSSRGQREATTCRPPVDRNLRASWSWAPALPASRWRAASGKAGLPATLIDRQNHHLFQPLLYQVATAALSPADIAEPIRKMLGRYASVEVMLGAVTAIDVTARAWSCSRMARRAFDILVLATGATHGYFGHEEWSGFAPGLKTIEDARRIRSRLLLTFEKAEMAESGGAEAADDDRGGRRRPDRRRTGRFDRGAGALHAGARFPSHPGRNRDGAAAGSRPANPCRLSGTARSLRDGTSSKVRRHGADHLSGANASRPAHHGWRRKHWRWGCHLGRGRRRLRARAQLGVAVDRAGRVASTATLSVAGLNGIYVLGDLALTPDDNGNPLPGLAQVAKQEGVYLGRALENNSARRRSHAVRIPQPRQHRDHWTDAAVFDFGWWRSKGWFAWSFWAVIHVYLLVGFQHRLLVAIQWLWRYLTYEHGARLIADNTEH